MRVNRISAVVTENPDSPYSGRAIPTKGHSDLAPEDPVEFSRGELPSYAHAGTTVNEKATTLFPNVPTDNDPCY